MTPPPPFRPAAPRPRSARRAAAAEAVGPLREVLGGLSGVAVQLDAAGAVVFVNDAFLDLTGWGRGEVVGAEWADGFVPAGCATRALFDGPLAAPARAEGEVFTRDGGRRVVAWDVVPVRDADGAAGARVAVGRDVTDERRGAAERARLARAVAALADRDPLTGLLNAHGFARVAEHAARIAARTRRLDAVLWVAVEDLDAARLAHGAAAADDAACAVAEALRGAVRDSDVVARVAPAVFVVYAVGTGTPGHGAAAAARVRDAISRQNARAQRAGRAFDLACTVRVAERAPGDSADALLARVAAAEPAAAEPAAAGLGDEAAAAEASWDAAGWDGPGGGDAFGGAPPWRA